MSHGGEQGQNRDDGLGQGRRISKKYRVSLHPSMLAASKSSPGMLDWMKVRAMIMLYTDRAPGTTMTQKVSIMWSWVSRM